MLIWIIDQEWDKYDIEKKIILQKYPDCDIRFSGNDYQKDLIDFGKNADAIILQISVKMDRSTIEKLNRCKVISVYGVGYDNVDIVAAKENAIKVYNVPSYCEEDVSDYIIAAIYDHSKLFKIYNPNDRLWGMKAIDGKLNRISNMTLLILGFGKIGKTTAKKAINIGMKVLCYDPFISDEEATEIGAKRVELDDGLAQADFISVNMKLCERTVYLLSSREFNLMKKSAYIINAARGKILDTKALVKAVNEGRISGATLDVLEKEPPEMDDEVLKCNKIKITPHISFYSEDSLYDLKVAATKNVLCNLD